MNEGENTGMPTSPDFSSPNTSPDNTAPSQPSELPEQPAAAPAPAEPVISSADKDTRPAQSISSGASTRPRFGFARKFKKTQQPAQAPAQQTVFGNAPEYFNNAVQDIVIADVAAADAKKKRKKIALIALAVVAVLAAGLGIFLLIVQLSKPSASSVKSAFNRYANYVLYGEEKSSDIGEYSDTTRYTIMDKYTDVDEDYNKNFKRLLDAFYNAYNDAVNEGTYEKDGMDEFIDTAFAVYSTMELDSSYTLPQMANDYLAEGRENVLSKLEDKYNSYAEKTDSRYIYDWRQTRLEYLELVSDYVNEGCSATGSIDEQCAEAAAGRNASVQSRLAKIGELEEVETESRISARVSFMEMLWRIEI